MPWPKTQQLTPTVRHHYYIVLTVLCKQFYGFMGFIYNLDSVNLILILKL